MQWQIKTDKRINEKNPGCEPRFLGNSLRDTKNNKRDPLKSRLSS